ncbi:helix-turn-helix domain-containing protein [Fusobacterium ulcerans]|uniref:helix-turn-helix domain-containing protein n=1 Tax=Fusobacterium ulcerans TaxID=861 RepID=UPI001D0AC827|nr:helix-turn-helix transcriptional regulator [Fusobacterium ulcerans]MCB8563717.1 helix-turn-helix domain-containing protein [Fusobacterium ulcerans]MCB8649688.1 helix-turn-helix domain-containing protein [Fusobacterium ulcerans]
MEFSKVLKKIRNENKDSLRKLGEKLGIHFTYVDKIEKEKTPINGELLEKIIKVYPEYKKELIEAYCDDNLPKIVIEEMKKPKQADKLIKLIKENDNLEYLYEILFQNLEIEAQKEILNSVIERIELLNFKNGTLEKEQEKIEMVKKAIKEL